MSQRTADEAIRELGSICEKHSGQIVSASVLPESKEFYKRAILGRLATSVDAKTRDLLLSTYLMLSDFQPLTDCEQMVVKDYDKLMKKPPPKECKVPGDFIAFGQFVTVGPLYSVLFERTAKEFKQLQDELRSVGAL